MLDNPKYVMFKLPDDAREHFIMVDPTQTHSQAVRSLAFSVLDQETWLKLDCPFEPISAGFVSIGPDRNFNTGISTYGKSVSLKDHAGNLAKEQDADIIAAAHADKGFLYTIFNNGGSFAVTVLGPTFYAEQARKAFGNYTIHSQGRVKIAFNEHYEMVIQSIEHLIAPEGKWAEQEASILKTFLGMH